jgi:C_GCAxxG_C_C family probable redox protein
VKSWPRSWVCKIHLTSLSPVCTSRRLITGGKYKSTGRKATPRTRQTVDLSKLDRYGNRAQFVEAVHQKAYDYDFKCHGCSQAVVQCFLDVFEEDNASLFMAASPFAAGMSMTGNNCGALIGGLMVLGVVFGRRSMDEGMEGIIDGIRPARRLVKHFQSRFGTLNCRDLTQTDLADPVKADAYFAGGGLETCAAVTGEVAAFVAGLLYDERAKKKSK